MANRAPLSFVPRRLIGGFEVLTPKQQWVDIGFIQIRVIFPEFEHYISTHLKKHTDEEELSAIFNEVLAPLIELFDRFNGEILHISANELVVWWPSMYFGQNTDKIVQSCSSEIERLITTCLNDIDSKQYKRTKITENRGIIARLGGHHGFWIPQIIQNTTEEDSYDNAVSFSFNVNAKSSVTENNLTHNYIPQWTNALISHTKTPLIIQAATVTTIVVTLPPQRSKKTIVNYLQSLVLAMQECTQQWDGIFASSHISGHEFIGVGVFGLPIVSDGLRPGLAIGCGLALLDVLNSRGIKASIGIATDKLCLSSIGSIQNHRFFWSGPALTQAQNIAKRSKNSVLCDFKTAQAAEDSIALSPYTEDDYGTYLWQATKVSETPQQVSNSLGSFGRKDVLLKLQTIFELVISGQTKAVVIEGEPGIGKTHVLETARQCANEYGLSILSLQGDPIKHATPWSTLQPLLLSIFNITPVQDPTSRAEQITQWLNKNNQTLQGLALLNPVLDTKFEDDDFSKPLQDYQRQEATLNLLVEFLAEYIGGKGIIFIDDLQWADPATVTVCSALRRVLKSFAIITALRTDATIGHEVSSLVSSSERFRLSGLSTEAISQLVAQKIGVSYLSTDLSHFIQSRTQGHPLFAIELVSALQSQHLVQINERRADISSNQALSTFPPPAKIEDMVCYRLEFLDEVERAVVEFASILGLNFDLAEFVEIYQTKIDKDYALKYLNTLAEKQILRWNNKDNLTFQTNLIQEVIYRTISEQDRKMNHHIAAQWYKIHLKDSPAKAAKIAWHLSRTDHWEQALPYLEQAWIASDAQGAASEGFNVIKQSIALDDRSKEAGRKSVGELRRAIWRRRQAYAAANDGRPDQLEELVLAGLNELKISLPKTKFQWSIFLIYQVLVHALHLIVPFKFWQNNKKDNSVSLETTKLWTLLSEAYAHRVKGNQIAILAASLRAVNGAERLNRDDAAVTAFAGLALVAVALRQRWLAENYRCRMIEAANRLNDLRVQSTAEFLTILIHMGNGQLTEARKAQTRVLPMMSYRAPASRVEGPLWYALALDACFLGNAAKVRELATSLLNHETPRSRAWGAIHLSNLALRMGNPQQGKYLAEQAWTLLKPHDDGALASALALLARAQAQLGQNTLALQTTNNLIEQLNKTALLFPTRLFAYAGPAEVGALLLENALDPSSKRLSYQGIKILRRYIRQFAVGKPRYLNLKARMKAALGQKKRCSTTISDGRN